MARLFLLILDPVAACDRGAPPPWSVSPRRIGALGSSMIVSNGLFIYR